MRREWMESAVGPEPEGNVFAGPKGKPVRRDTQLYDRIRPKINSTAWSGLIPGDAGPTPARAPLKLDLKVTADQRAHGVGVAIAEYTKTSLKDRAVTAKNLEEVVAGKPKVIQMPRQKAS